MKNAIRNFDNFRKNTKKITKIVNKGNIYNLLP